MTEFAPVLTPYRCRSAGDVIGSIYEFDNIKSKSFTLIGDSCHFTDDSVLTVALADSLLSGDDFAAVMRRYYR